MLPNPGVASPSNSQSWQHHGNRKEHRHPESWFSFKLNTDLLDTNSFRSKCFYSSSVSVCVLAMGLCIFRESVFMFFYLDELLIERRYALFVLDRYILYLSEFIAFSYFFAIFTLLDRKLYEYIE